MEKVQVILGKRESGKTLKANEILKNSGLIPTIIKGSIKRVSGHFFFSACERDTEIIMIDEVTSIYSLEKLIMLVQFAIPVEKQGKEAFSIQLKKVVIVCAESITKEDIANLGSSYTRRIELIEITP